MCNPHEFPELTEEERQEKARVEAETARSQGHNALADTILREAGL